jgi:DNA-binding beta-propeller fold protein YncE
MKNFFPLICIIVLAVSCIKTQDKPIGTFLTGEGVFLINEGNFMGGNGSLSYYSYDSSKIYNDLFSNINGRPLGDVPNSIGILNEKAYVIVNNSGKIEVIKKSTLESVKTITNIVSPRNISFINADKAYVTSMYSDSLIIIDLMSNSVSGYINIRRSSESIVSTGNKAFVASWVGGSEVMVIDTDLDMVIDSIEVGIEPESMALDKNNKLWVLCNGGWARENFAELIRINTAENAVEERLIFPAKQESPSCLRIDGTREILYYLNAGVCKMNITEAALPTVPLIAESGHYFYKMDINPSNGDIFVTDAVDYQQSGHLIYYHSDATFAADLLADIIPGSMCFKSSDN